LLRQKLSKQLKPWKNKVRQAEAEIEQLEARKQEMERLMADPELYADQAKWSEVSREYNGVGRRLERHYALWEEAQEQVESIEQQT